jgi:hypothetical protein
MPLIAGYLLKLSVSLSVVYLFYILVLRRLTFYTWNRWYLLGYSLLAFFIPFVNISPVLEKSDWDNNTLIQLIPIFNYHTAQADIHQQAFAWWWYLLAGTGIGMLLMIVRFIVRFISYQRIRNSASLMVDAGVKVYHVDKSIIPFSFGNAIFINPQLHSEEDLRQIIHHEFIHVKQKHTIDILWSELLCMLNWYNPFAWLIRKAIRQNLEFIADHKVLENGIDKKHYQYLLLKVTGAAHFSITQQFNFSSLKKRIIMMNRSRSAKIQLMRFMFMLPLVTIMLLAFRSSVIEQQHEKKVALSKPYSVVPFTEVQKTDTIPTGKIVPTWDNFLKRNPSVKKLAIEKSIDGAGGITPVMVVFKKDGTEERYNWSKAKDVELLKKRYGFFPKFPEDPEEKPQPNIIIDSIIMVDASLKGPGSPYQKLPSNDVLYVVNGVVQAEFDNISKIDPSDIESITILKDEQSDKTYGYKAKGKNGVIEILTKSAPKVNLTSGSVIRATIDSITLSGSGNATVKISGRSGPGPSLYIVDDIEYSPEEFLKLNLDPNLIESISVFKNDLAISKYGNKGKDGVIVIKTKRPITLATQEPLDMNIVSEIFKGSDQPIHIINGYTYANANSGRAIGSMQGIINTVIVDDKLYTVEEVNRLFVSSQFSTAGCVGAQEVLREHGKNEPAMLLSRNGNNFNKYRPFKKYRPTSQVSVSQR